MDNQTSIIPKHRLKIIFVHFEKWLNSHIWPNLSQFIAACPKRTKKAIASEKKKKDKQLRKLWEKWVGVSDDEIVHSFSKNIICSLYRHFSLFEQKKKE